jgi:hypothetical protein
VNFDREGGKERGQGVIALSSNFSIYNTTNMKNLTQMILRGNIPWI